MNINSLTDEELIDRAIVAWLRRDPSNPQPSRYTSTIEDGRVVLTNRYGELARYRITSRGLRYAG